MNTGQKILTNTYIDSSHQNSSGASGSLSRFAAKKVVPWAEYKVMKVKRLNTKIEPPPGLEPPKENETTSSRANIASSSDENLVDTSHTMYKPHSFEDVDDVSPTFTEPPKPTIIDKIKPPLVVARPLKQNTKFENNFTANKVRNNPFLVYSSDEFSPDEVETVANDLLEPKPNKNVEEPQLMIDKKVTSYESDSEDDSPKLTHKPQHNKFTFETEWLDDDHGADEKLPKPNLLNEKKKFKVETEWLEETTVVIRNIRKTLDKAPGVGFKAPLPPIPDRSKAPPPVSQRAQVAPPVPPRTRVLPAIPPRGTVPPPIPPRADMKAPKCSTESNQAAKDNHQIDDENWESEIQNLQAASNSSASTKPRGITIGNSFGCKPIEFSKESNEQQSTAASGIDSSNLPSTDSGTKHIKTVTKDRENNQITIDVTRDGTLVAEKEMSALPDDIEIALLTIDLPSDVFIHAKNYPPAEIPIELIQGKKDVHIWVSEIYSPYKFWFHLDISSNSEELSELSREMNVFYTDIDNHKFYQMPKHDVFIGRACAAVFENLWYRGEIVGDYSDKTNKVRVFFVDYGTTSHIKLENVCYLNHIFAGPQRMAYRGRLAFVKPKASDNRWHFGIPGDATRCFLQLVCDLQVYAKIFAYEEEEKVFHMLLYDVDSEPEPVCVNERMAETGYCHFDSTYDFFPHPEDVYPSFDMLEKGIAKSYSVLAKRKTAATVVPETLKELESKPRNRKIIGISLTKPFPKPVGASNDYWRPIESPVTVDENRNELPQRLPPSYENALLETFPRSISLVQDDEMMESNYAREVPPTYETSQILEESRILANNPFTADLTLDEQQYLVDWFTT